MEDFAPVLVTLIIFYFVAYIVRISYENRTRQRLIDKGLSEEQIKGINIIGSAPEGPSSLKWGIVSTAVGLGLFLRILLNDIIRAELRDEFTLGLMLLLAGLSLIIYHFILRSRRDENEKQ